MSDVILFHHVLGVTEGIEAFADALRSAGHRVEVPDLFEGRTFPSIEAGVAHAEKIGFPTVIQRGVAAAESLPPSAVYAGFSMGALPAQVLAQTRPGVGGAIFYHGGLPPEELDAPWPAGIQAQVHLCVDDDWCKDEAVPLAEAVDEVELYTYPGSAHLFTDSSWKEYDSELTSQVLKRTLQFLSSR